MEQLHFRTDRVAPARRFESWRQTLFDTYYRLDCHVDDARMPSAPFRGVLESRINGGVRCSRVPSLLLRLRLADDSIWDIVDTETDQLLDQLRVLYSRMLGR